MIHANLDSCVFTSAAFCLCLACRYPGDYVVGIGRPLRFKDVAHLSEDAAVEAWLKGYQVSSAVRRKNKRRTSEEQEKYKRSAARTRTKKRHREGSQKRRGVKRVLGIPNAPPSFSSSQAEVRRLFAELQEVTGRRTGVALEVEVLATRASRQKQQQEQQRVAEAAKKAD
jgi:hypothetical protein